MTSYTSLNVILMIVFSSLGSLLGAILLYYIGKILNKDRLKKIVRGKIGKVLFLKKKKILIKLMHGLIIKETRVYFSVDLCQ